MVVAADSVEMDSQALKEVEWLFYGQIEEGLQPGLVSTPLVKRPVVANYNRVGVWGNEEGWDGWAGKD